MPPGGAEPRGAEVGAPPPACLVGTCRWRWWWARVTRPRLAPPGGVTPRSFLQLPDPPSLASQPLINPSTASSSFIPLSSSPRVPRLCPSVPRAPRGSPAYFLQWRFRASPNWLTRVRQILQEGPSKPSSPCPRCVQECPTCRCLGSAAGREVPSSLPALPGLYWGQGRSSSRVSKERLRTTSRLWPLREDPLSFPGCPQVFLHLEAQ